MSATIQSPDRFTALPDDRTLSETVAALEGRGLEIHQDDPGRIHIVLIRQLVGF